MLQEPQEVDVDELENEPEVQVEHVQEFARLWPRAIFDHKSLREGDELPILRRPGVYVLYRDDVPYYIGKTNRRLGDRIYVHAKVVESRRYHFWNYFSVFAIDNENMRTAVEALLIAALPTANSSEPSLPRTRLSKKVCDILSKSRE